METLPGSSDGQNQMDESLFFQIHLKGHLDDTWADWFEGLTITNLEDGESIVSGSIADQAALHGIINRINNLGLKLVSVSTEPDKDLGT